MRKICGGQNYHEEYLKTPSNAIANEDITPFVRSSDQVHDVDLVHFKRNDSL